MVGKAKLRSVTSCWIVNCDAFVNYTALTPDEQSLFFMVLYHCKDISRPMLSNINWDQDNAGRIVMESLKQIQVVIVFNSII